MKYASYSKLNWTTLAVPKYFYPDIERVLEGYEYHLEHIKGEKFWIGPSFFGDRNSTEKIYDKYGCYQELPIKVCYDSDTYRGVKNEDITVFKVQHDGMLPGSLLLQIERVMEREGVHGLAITESADIIRTRPDYRGESI